MQSRPQQFGNFPFQFGAPAFGGGGNFPQSFGQQTPFQNSNFQQFPSFPQFPALDPSKTVGNSVKQWTERDKKGDHVRITETVDTRGKKNRKVERLQGQGQRQETTSRRTVQSQVTTTRPSVQRQQATSRQPYQRPQTITTTLRPRS